MNDHDLDAAVADALDAEASEVHAGPDLLDRIERRLAGEPARHGTAAQWVLGAAAALVVLVGTAGALALLDRPDRSSVTASAPADETPLLLVGAVPAGYELVAAERATRGNVVAHPLTPERAHFLQAAPGGGVIFADWVDVPSALPAQDAHDLPVSPFAGGRAVTVSDTALGAQRSEVHWTGGDLSGWLISETEAAQALVDMAGRFVGDGTVRPPDGFDAVPVHDDRATTRVRYERAGPVGTAPSTIELSTYATALDVEVERTLATRLGTPFEVVDVAGTLGVLTDGGLRWSPDEGVTARLQDLSGALEPDVLLAMAEGVVPVSEERWSTEASAAGADPRPFAWRTVTEGTTREGGGWAVARREPTDGPGCFNLLVFEHGGGGPAWSGDAPVSLHTLVAVRVPSAAVEVELVSAEGTVATSVHPLDEQWSVAVGEVAAPIGEAAAEAFEVRAFDADGARVR